ncbi:MAG: response regulator [Planctomycetota bacterium]|jgi:two-component system cell cycle sensor histidine kinase/response regulator CckA|nr:response regulator [Planctomycetota bacterium]
MYETTQTNAAASALNVLLVDDREGEFLLLRRLLDSLPKRPYRIHWASTAEEAILLVQQVPKLDVILLDVALGADRNGLDLLIDLVEQGLTAPCIMLTVLTDEEFEAQCIRAGAADYLIKSELSAAQLHRTIRHARERYRMQQALARSEQRYRTLAANFPKGAVLVIDADGHCHSADGAALTSLGIDAAAAPGTHIRELLGSELGELLSDRLSLMPDEGVRSFETTVAGRAFLAHLCALGDSHHQIVVQDITDLRGAEQAVLQSSRLASIGTLTGGVAHEFNNLHSLIIGNLERLLRSPPSDPAQVQRLQAVRDGVWRAAEVTRNLLSLARGFRTTFELGSLHDLVDETIGLIRHDFEANGIQLETHFDTLPNIWLQPSGIGQVLINLLINAKHALHGCTNPRVEVRAETRGTQAVLSISDNGCGIEASDLERVFTPFYTTKDPDQTSDGGTGLGLTVCRTIVVNHGGELSVRSEPNLGTTFALALPLNRMVPPADPAPQGVPSARLRAVRKRACDYTLMVIEDDDALRELICETLSDEGYHVTAAADGVEALDLLRQCLVHLVVVDLQLPRRSGWDFIEALHQQAKPPAVVVTSGHHLDPPDESHASLVDGFIAKPFELEQLCSTIACALSRRSERSHSGPSSR